MPQIAAAVLLLLLAIAPTAPVRTDGSGLARIREALGRISGQASAECPGALPIAEARRMPPDSQVTVRGVVSVPTGAFTAAQSFALQDATGGLYVYRYAGIGQRLGLGDQVCVRGRLVQYHGLLELVPASAFQIVRLDSGQPPQPKVVDPARIGEATEGLLVSITGPVTDLGANRFRVGGAMVYLDSTTGITAEGLTPGCNATVIGLSADYDGAQIWPRTQADIVPLACAPTTCADLTVAQIQGSGTASPYDGQVGLSCLAGCVTGIGANGFYIQSPAPDDDPRTSEGLFVFRYSGWTNPAGLRAGDLVEIRDFGVQEFYGSTEIVGLRDDSGSSYRRIGTCPSPEALPIPPLADPRADPEGVYERFEGMRVSMRFDGSVVGPTVRYASRFESGEPQTALVPSDSPFYGGRVFPDDLPPGHGMIYLSGGLGHDLPDVGIGDRLSARDLTGVLAYQFGHYVLLVDGSSAPPAVVEDVPDINDSEAPIGPDEFALCTFNLANLFDAADDGDGDMGDWAPADDAAFGLLVEKRAAAIREDLGRCTVVGLQEVEGKDSTWQALADAVGGSYRFDYYESPDERDITVGILYDARRVAVRDSAQVQACTPTDYGVDYRWAVGVRSRPNPCAAGTYPLHDRPPYVADLTIRDAGGTRALDVRVVVTHFKSKIGDEAVNLPRRTAQARHVAALLDRPVAAALGDFNDLPGSAPLREFAPYTSLIEARLPPADRYTYIYNGFSEAIDHIIMTPGLDRYFRSGSPVHINADFPDRRTPDRTGRRSSDHDPVIARFAFRPTGVSDALAGLATGAAAALSRR